MNAIRTPQTPTHLDAILAGAEVDVIGVEAGHAEGRRLLALGFVPGTRVRVVRSAPLRDPVEYELRGTRVSLRRTEAALVTVATPSFG